jgi:outer membrane murein-binding lipoprotein Lpp
VSNDHYDCDPPSRRDPLAADVVDYCAQIRLMNARIDQLATKVNGIDATFGAKLEETNAKLNAASTKLDAISQRLPT